MFACTQSVLLLCIVPGRDKCPNKQDLERDDMVQIQATTRSLITVNCYCNSHTLKVNWTQVSYESIYFAFDLKCGYNDT